MKRILLSAAVLVAVGAFLVLAGGASNGPSPVGSYKIMLDNAFGLVSGADFKVAGVPAGKIGTIELTKACTNGGGDTACHALVNVNVTQKNFGQFRTDAFCQTRPESLIGEYYIECQPGTKGKVIPPGGTIPVQDTESTIPFDLVQDISQMPYRERFTLIINELGAAVAGRSGDLQQALQRAVPALTQTDNLLNLLADDSRTLQNLTTDSNTVITALADNSPQVQRFIVEANNASTDSATQQAAITATWQKLPGFLEQLRPTMQKLGVTADTNDPVLRNLIAASGQLRTLFTNLAPCTSPHTDHQCGFDAASLPSLQALGQASVTGKVAVQAAAPTIRDLNRATGGTNCLSHDLYVDQHPGSQFNRVNGLNQICLPELAQNLATVLPDLDNPNRAVEPDTRSPGGKGFSGLEALLWYAFVQPLSINTYGQFGHLLNVNAYIDPRCSPYATPQSIANGLQQYGPSFRQCYAFLGPNQPGINETDPSNPSACVPDPGGSTPGEPGPKTSACKLSASSTQMKSVDTASADGTPGTSGAGSAKTATAGAGGSSSSGGGVAQTLGRIFSSIAGGSSGGAGGSGSGSTGSSSGSSAGTGGSSGGSPGQSQQLLKYLLAP